MMDDGWVYNEGGWNKNQKIHLIETHPRLFSKAIGDNAKTRLVAILFMYWLIMAFGHITPVRMVVCRLMFYQIFV